jgi:ribosomal protein L7/L12
VDIWFWSLVAVAGVLVVLVMLGRRAAASRVDPTQVSIDAAVAEQVREMYAKGDKLAAVKALRAATGLGLADAIRIADKLAAGAKPAPPRTVTAKAVRANIGPDHVQELRSLVAAGQQGEAISLVRQLTGMDQQDAKDYVDRL